MAGTHRRLKWLILQSEPTGALLAETFRLQPAYLSEANHLSQLVSSNCLSCCADNLILLIFFLLKRSIFA